MKKFFNFLNAIRSKAVVAVAHAETEQHEQKKADVIEDRPWWKRKSGFIDGADLPYITGQGRVAGRYFRKLQTQNGMYKI